MTKLLLVLVALSAYASANSAELPRYQALDIGTLGGKNSLATAINEAGQVTGFANTANGEFHAFLYSDGRMIDLGTFGGPGSVGFDINEAGQVTGFATTADNLQHAFLYVDGTMTNLGELAGGDRSEGKGINESGQIAGDSSVGRDLHAVLYEDGEMSDLGTLDGNGSQVVAINDIGEVIGTFSNFRVGNEFSRPFVYRNGAMLDLGSLGGDFATPTDINESGQVVGNSQTADSAFGHAFLHSGQEMVDLGTLGGDSSGAWALNDVGEVVGSSTTKDGVMHAFLFSRGLMVDIGAMLGEEESAASEINNQGVVIGQVFGGGGAGYLFVYSDGEMSDVNDLVVSLIPRPVRRNVVIVDAGGGNHVMNDRGQFIARAIFENAQRTLPKRTHAVVLTPISLLFEQLVDKVIGAELNDSPLNKVRESFSHYLANRKPGTCSKLQSFIQQVGSLPATSIPAALKRDLLASARAIRQAVGCS